MNTMTVNVCICVYVCLSVCMCMCIDDEGGVSMECEMCEMKGGREKEGCGLMDAITTAHSWYEGSQRTGEHSLLLLGEDDRSFCSVSHFM
ncbi:MAG: hypothetical protein J3Q66DRAFT_321139 [Benniella sp.]|nr:MAG: hypothetical protein J3Q66DRAFT_321139 [Benniella sp.]